MDKMFDGIKQNEEGKHEMARKLFSTVDIGKMEEEPKKLFSTVDTGKMKEEQQQKKKLFDLVGTEQCDNKSGQSIKLFSRVEPQSAFSKRDYSVDEKEVCHCESRLLVEPSPVQLPMSLIQVDEDSRTRIDNTETALTADDVDTIKSTITDTLTEEWKNFDLQLIKRLRRIIDTPEGEKSLLFYHFSILRGTEYFEATVRARDVDKFSWVQDAAEGKAFIKRTKNGMSFAEYVSNCITRCNVIEDVVYGTNGWKKIHNSHFYVLPKANTGCFSNNISGNTNTDFEVLEGYGDINVFRQTFQMLKICSDQGITLPLFLFTYAGALTSVFDEARFPIKFLMAVIGETNSRKTSLSLCMTKTFNRKKIHAPEVTFNSPEGGIETKVSLHPDSVLVIDDFMPAATRSKQNLLDTKLEKLIRMYGERKGIDRMTDFAKNPNAGYYPVKGIAVITGEHIRGVQSSLTRCLIINVKPDSVDNTLLGFYQENYQYLSSSIYDFLKFVTEHYEEVKKFISQKAFAHRAQNLFNPPRYSEMYAVLMTVAEIFLQYSVSRNFFNDTERQQIYIQWETILKNVISANTADLKEQSFGSILLRVCKYIMENRCINALPEEGQANYDNLIFADDTFIYMRMDTFIKEFKGYTVLWGIDCPVISKKYILDELEKIDLIETKGKAEGKRTHKLPGGKGNGQRFVILKKDTIKNSQSTED